MRRPHELRRGFAYIIAWGAFLCIIGVVGYAIGAISPHATRLTTIAGFSVAGPDNSDCQPYLYLPSNLVAWNCPVKFIPITAAGGSHTVQPNEWGTVLVASGGGVVQFVLPPTTAIGRNAVSFATDSNTGFSISAQAPNTMQGSGLINNGTLTAGPNADGWAGLSGNIWQVNVR